MALPTSKPNPFSKPSPSSTPAPKTAPKVFPTSPTTGVDSSGQKYSIAPSKPSLTVGGKTYTATVGGSHHGGGVSSPSQPVSQPQQQTSSQVNQEVAKDVRMPFQPPPTPNMNQYIQQQIRIQQQTNPQQQYGKETSIGLPQDKGGIFGRIGRFIKGYGYKEDKPILGGQGQYNYLGYASSTPSGRGTIQTPQVTTKLEQNYRELALAKVPIESIQSKVVSDVSSKWQGFVDNQLYTPEEAQAKANEEVRIRLENNSDYQKAITNYQNTANKVGLTTDAAGRQFIKGTSQIDMRSTGEKIRETAASALITLFPPATLANAAQKTELTYNEKTGQITESMTREGKIQAGIASVALLTGGFYGVRSIEKGINAETAASEFNRGLKSGEYKITPEMIKAGEIKVPIRDFKTGNMIQQTIKVDSNQLAKTANQIAKRQEYQRAISLGENRKVNIDMRGTQVEKKITIEALQKENPKIFESIKNVEAGRYSRLKPSGRSEEGFIVRGTQQTAEGNKALTTVFRMTKDGKIIGLRTVAENEGTSFIGRPAFPSEMKPFNIGQLKVEPIERIKTVEVLKSKANQQIKYSQEQADKIMNVFDKESIAFKIGRQAKGTQSAFDYLNPEKANIVFEKSNILPISKYRGQRVEIIPKGAVVKDINAEISNDMISLQKKLGTSSTRQGVTFEAGTIEQIPKPVNFKNVPIERGRGIEDFSYLKRAVNKASDKTFNPITPSNVKGGEFQILEGLQEPDKMKAFGQVQSLKDLESNQAAIERALNTKQNYLPRIGKLDINAEGNFELGFKFEGKGFEPEFNFNKEIRRDITIPEQKLNIKSSNIMINSQDLLKDLNKSLVVTPSYKSSQSQILNIIPAQITQQKITQVQTPSFNIPQFKLPKFPIKPISEIPFDFGFGLPSKMDRGQGNQWQKMMKPKKFKFTPAYSADIGSAVFQKKAIKVTRKQFERLNRATFSGGEVRPLIQIVDDKSYKKALKKVQF